jgi:hypothetical protein
MRENRARDRICGCTGPPSSMPNHQAIEARSLLHSLVHCGSTPRCREEAEAWSTLDSKLDPPRSSHAIRSSVWSRKAHTADYPAAES